MICRICEQDIIARTEHGHHLEASPVDSGLCLGCWIGCLEFETFILRATGRSVWTLEVERTLKQLIGSIL